MSWNFAIVNNRLAEIYFDENKNGPAKIWGHCYVKLEDYKTKTEQRWIKQDISRIRVVYKDKKYKLVTPSKNKTFPHSEECGNVNPDLKIISF